MSKWNFEVADTDGLFDLFAKAELYYPVQQGKRSLEDIQAKIAQRAD